MTPLAHVGPPQPRKVLGVSLGFVPEVCFCRGGSEIQSCMKIKFSKFVSQILQTICKINVVVRCVCVFSRALLLLLCFVLSALAVRIEGHIKKRASEKQPSMRHDKSMQNYLQSWGSL